VRNERERTEERGNPQGRAFSPHPSPPPDGRDGEIKELDAGCAPGQIIGNGPRAVVFSKGDVLFRVGLLFAELFPVLGVKSN
jgi:hypothetical protein